MAVYRENGGFSSMVLSTRRPSAITPHLRRYVRIGTTEAKHGSYGPVRNTSHVHIAWNKTRPFRNIERSRLTFPQPRFRRTSNFQGYIGRTTRHVRIMLPVATAVVNPMPTIQGESIELSSRQPLATLVRPHSRGSLRDVERSVVSSGRLSVRPTTSHGEKLGRDIYGAGECGPIVAPQHGVKLGESELASGTFGDFISKSTADEGNNDSEGSRIGDGRALQSEVRMSGVIKPWRRWRRP